jgi:hypothetical protein
VPVGSAVDLRGGCPMTMRYLPDHSRFAESFGEALTEQAEEPKWHMAAEAAVAVLRDADCAAERLIGWLQTVRGWKRLANHHQRIGNLARLALDGASYDGEWRTAGRKLLQILRECGLRAKPGSTPPSHDRRRRPRERRSLLWAEAEARGVMGFGRHFDRSPEWAAGLRRDRLGQQVDPCLGAG